MPIPGNRKRKNGGFNARFVKQNESMMREKNAINESALHVDATSASRKFDNAEMTDKLDSQMGFDRYEQGPKKVGWLVNFHSTTIKSSEVMGGLAGVNYYFLDEEGGSFKATVQFDPYVLLACTLLSNKYGHEIEVEEFLRRKLDGLIKAIHRLEKENLSLPNHLVGNRQRLLKLDFHNVSDLLAARKIIMPLVESNKSNQEVSDSYAEVSLSTLLGDSFIDVGRAARSKDAAEYLLDIFEYDVPYHVRVAIDKDIRVGKWYTVEAINGTVKFTEMPERIARADPIVMAYDIETTKAPLKFPDPAIDKVMMISYMIDGEGFLITNREIVSKDIEDFEYTPKPEFKGVFTVFNEPTERNVLVRFFEHIREEKPTVIATFNGDFFDWPFIEARASFHGLNMYQEIGFQKDVEEEYKSAHCAHMDCFRWVKRDSYLPQGSQGLKAVTTAKLGYNPIEIDPELMTPYAIERPQTMAEYSVSDAVATYYLYMKYVHPFIFSLCTIIPLNPDEVLRKGTGTLCEMLLMVQAYKNNILLPHKHKEPLERFYNGHLLDAETYVGGHVESLEAGVFRSDIPCEFKVDTTAIDELLRDLDSALHFTITVEGKKKMEDVTNYEDVKTQISDALFKLKSNPKCEEKPSIYHVDVASMYPNIMTTNRLQPDSMITEEDCAGCDFNRPGKTCDKRLPWSWRGEFYPPKKDEYLMIRRALQNEQFPGKSPKHPTRSFDDLSPTEQAAMVRKRLTEYSKKVYHKIRQSETIEREAIICQRENPFYVNTVRDFRDRRYEFKSLQKVWKKKMEEIPNDDIALREEANKMVVLYDSLQLAHKVILNSFYGYVMRKGSRWYSMEMAGVTCLTGATIIQMARSLVERIGRPLELDTDGIWCILPKTFPEDFMFTFKDGKKLPVSYPCVMLNHLVHARFTNHQYQTLVDEKTLQYETTSDNSIFFEVDGPYKAMVLPTSKEEDKNLKKRYAVFNHDGSLAELKGFELKRRGELRLIKAFQSQIFNFFLHGSTLTECYGAVAKVADSWLDILESKGQTLEDEDLLDLISENRSMSKTLEEYGSRKSTSICTARRLAEFLGSQMVKEKGLACKYIISKKPLGAPITDRAVPVAIFSAELSDKSHYLRLWQRDPSLDDFDPRAIIDWDYYRERLASTIQKIITIPAALQNVKNPVPRIPHPEWLFRRVATKNDRLKQQSMASYLVKGNPMADASNKANRLPDKALPDAPISLLSDIEDITLSGAKAVVTPAKRKNPLEDQENQNERAILVEHRTTLSADDDYSAWLKVQKVKWKAQRQSQARRKHLFGDLSHRTDNSLTGMIRNQTETAYSNTWHVLQYCASERPGEVLAFVNINDRIQRVRINVPRKIFVNFKQDLPLEGFIPGCDVQKVNHMLPNGHQSSNLFRFSMPESIFTEELSKPDSILRHSSVEGIYESQIDLKDRVLLELGTKCVLDSSQPGLLGKGLEKGFEFEWLQKVDKEPYLMDSKHCYVFFYHITTHDYQIFAIIPSWANEATVFVLRPTGSENLPSLSRLYKEQFAARIDRIDNSVFEYQSEVKFEELYFESSKRLYQRLGSVLSKLHSEKGTRAIVCLQSQRSARLKRLIRHLNEFPILEIRQSASVPSLGWQTSVAKKVVLNYFGLSSWVTHLKSMSRYSDIPLGNMKCDDARYLIDVTYARKLQAAGVVLWWSPGPIPDNGGSEKDNILPLMDPLDMPVVNNPGTYSKVCLDFAIRNLSVNTILTASIISEAEGTDMANTMVEEAEGAVPFVENAFSTPALSVLSSLVKEWWQQALQQNINADTMVHNFIGWVSSSDSLLYDRSLYYHVQNLSKKAFIQLIREIRRLGSQLVFANQNRLILLTSKSAIENTIAYSNFVVKSIRSKPLFNYLDISIKGYWDTLIWMDDVNYGGQLCVEISSEKEQNIETFMNWHIKNFLPEILQPEFEESVLKFILSYWKASRADETNSKSERLTQVSSTALARANNKGAAGEEGEREEEHFAHGLFRDMEKPLLKRVELLRRRYVGGVSHKEVEQEFAFPIRPGSYLNLTNPILQLIKSICAVFATCKELMLEVRLVRRHLLQLVEVKEFSEESQFQNPSSSLVLSNVLCDSCGSVRDLDLCKNEDLVREQDVGNSKMFTWLCEGCGKEYSRVSLEELLIQQLQRSLTMYQVQDLKCVKCRRIRDDNMSDHCECSGSWTETIPRASIAKMVDSYKRVADYYSFSLVSDLITEVNV